jgi:hypothetical protein
VVHERLKLTTYKLQLVHKLQENYSPRRYHFAAGTLSRTDEDSGYLSKACFSDEAIFTSLIKLTAAIAESGNHKILMLFGRMNVIPLMRTFGADYPVRE